MKNLTDAIIENAIAQFAIEGTLKEKRPYGNGHINDTFLLTYETPSGSETHYILQRMNNSIFKNPQQLMENMVHVTEYLRKIIAANGGDPERETLNAVKTRSGGCYYEDGSGNFWRVLLFLVSKKFALLKKPTSPSRFQTHPAAPELFGLCVIPAAFLKGGKNVSADNP